MHTFNIIPLGNTHGFLILAYGNVAEVGAGRFRCPTGRLGWAARFVGVGTGPTCNYVTVRPCRSAEAYPVPITPGGLQHTSAPMRRDTRGLVSTSVDVRRRR